MQVALGCLLCDWLGLGVKEALLGVLTQIKFLPPGFTF